MYLFFCKKNPQSFKHVTKMSISFLPPPPSPAPCSHRRLPTCTAARLDLRRDQHQNRGPARDQQQLRRPLAPMPRLTTCTARREGDLRRRPPQATPPAPLKVAAHVRPPSPPTCASDFVRFGRRCRGQFRPLPPLMLLLVDDAGAVDL